MKMTVSLGIGVTIPLFMHAVVAVYVVILHIPASPIADWSVWGDARLIGQEMLKPCEGLRVSCALFEPLRAYSVTSPYESDNAEMTTPTARRLQRKWRRAEPVTDLSA
ncbi:hypothetical protein BKA66DRAFT_464193, partial [Pyrenochaeta sp. MPI-SDFR-AT-0127]